MQALSSGHECLLRSCMTSACDTLVEYLEMHLRTLIENDAMVCHGHTFLAAQLRSAATESSRFCNLRTICKYTVRHANAVLQDWKLVVKLGTPFPVEKQCGAACS